MNDSSVAYNFVMPKVEIFMSLTRIPIVVILTNIIKIAFMALSICLRLSAEYN